MLELKVSKAAGSDQQIKPLLEGLMETKTKIIQSLELLKNFFEKHNVFGWTKRTRQAIQQIELEKDSKIILNDFVGVGMGSLIDLYLCAENGHTLKESEEDTNTQLQKLTENILRIKNGLR